MHVTDPPDSPPRPKPHARKRLARCRYCQKTYEKKKSWQHFCNSKCRNNFWNNQRVIEEVFIKDEK
jgi:hypothetical protein